MRLINVCHSGNVGDIIYSLPSLIGLIQNNKCDKINYYIKLNVPMSYSGDHPLGNVLMNEDFYLKLKPLLESQSYINSVGVYVNERIDIDLDTFRKIPINFRAYSIPRWYFLFIVGSSYDLSLPWIFVKADDTFKDFCLVSRNKRYNSQFINYSSLNKYAKKIVYVGVEKEFREFQIECPDVKEFYCASSFLELAQKIKGCGCFIGPAGFPFALAESMNVIRLLETNTQCPNVIPQGGEYHEALFQQGFNFWSQRLMEKI
jgi:hypothetical protein